jgi:hypothetical protein
MIPDSSYTHPLIEELLEQFGPVIGRDIKKYRNHVYRVFWNCLLADNDKSNEEKYAIAAVFHDIGIWTDHTIDYLDPSIEQLKKWLLQSGLYAWTEEISLMIWWHHKTKTYRGHYERTVESFRKADWIDVSLGWITYGLDKQKIKGTRERFPNEGLHWFLIKKLFKNFFRHPLKPLPMFK